MRDLIIGLILGVMATTIAFYHFSLSSRVVKIEGKMERVVQDVESIALKVGPLKGARK